MPARGANMKKGIMTAWQIAQTKRKNKALGKDCKYINRNKEEDAIAAFIAVNGVTKLDTLNDAPVNGIYGTPSPKVISNWRS